MFVESIVKKVSDLPVVLNAKMLDEVIIYQMVPLIFDLILINLLGSLSQKKIKVLLSAPLV